MSLISYAHKLSLLTAIFFSYKDGFEDSPQYLAY